MEYISCYYAPAELWGLLPATRLGKYLLSKISKGGQGQHSMFSASWDVPIYGKLVYKCSVSTILYISIAAEVFLRPCKQIISDVLVGRSSSFLQVLKKQSQDIMYTFFMRSFLNLYFISACSELTYPSHASSLCCRILSPGFLSFPQILHFFSPPGPENLIFICYYVIKKYL